MIRTQIAATIALAAWAGLFSAGQTAQAAEHGAQEPRISVSATGSSALEPDMAILSLSVVREAATARAALDENSAAMGAVLDALKAMGIDDRDMQTANFSIQPKYSYKRPSSGGQQVPEIEGYTVRNALTVRVRQLENLGNIIDESVSLGVNDGGNITFSNDDPSGALSEARKSAMQAAIAKAEELTQAAGVGLGQLLVITEATNQPQPVPMARMASEAAIAVPVASGENNYSVTVNVTFAIDQ